jgi:hypothetical protein
VSPPERGRGIEEDCFACNCSEDDLAMTDWLNCSEDDLAMTDCFAWGCSEENLATTKKATKRKGIKNIAVFSIAFLFFALFTAVFATLPAKSAGGLKSFESHSLILPPNLIYLAKRRFVQLIFLNCGKPLCVAPCERRNGNPLFDSPPERGRKEWKPLLCPPLRGEEMKPQSLRDYLRSIIRRSNLPLPIRRIASLVKPTKEQSQ